jgi:CubicO group peptidase (beta-lactamase class C family)
MTRQSRLASGWALALVAALLLNLAVTRPTAAPVVTVAAVSPTPRAAPAYAPDPFDTQPHTLTRPDPVDWVAGSARPRELRPVPASQAAALQVAVERVRTRFHLSTLAVGISVPGDLGWSGAAGVARDGITPLTAHSPFVIASITKTFTAALILQLVEERHLSLDTEVAALLPEVVVPAGVTVEQLLRHTSGIADLLRPLRPVLNTDTERRFTPAEVVAAVGPAWWPPGTDWGYSNTNYVLLGMIVERITGQPFADVLQQRLLEPLLLEGSGLLDTPGAPWLMPPAWVTAFWTSGSMYATADDLLRWGDALYDGDVLPTNSLERMLTFDQHPYGLGVEQLSVGGRTGYGHSGLLRGFTSLLVRLPAEGVTLVVLSTGPRYDPAELLAAGNPGQPSILDLALGSSTLASSAP